MREEGGIHTVVVRHAHEESDTYGDVIDFGLQPGAAITDIDAGSRTAMPAMQVRLFVLVVEAHGVERDSRARQVVPLHSRGSTMAHGRARSPIRFHIFINLN